jgi:hypothetical protein
MPPYGEAEYDPHNPWTWPRPKKDEIPLEYEPTVWELGPGTGHNGGPPLNDPKDGDGEGPNRPSKMTSLKLTSRAWLYHKKAKPKKNTKEKKTKTQGIQARITKIALMSTEFNDLLEAFEKALPKDARIYDANLYDRLENVYENLEEIDPEALVYNIVENYHEDAMVGRSNAKMRKGASSTQTDISRKVSQTRRYKRKKKEE